MLGGKPSTLAWIVVHLGYPLLPFVLEGSIRLVAADWHLSFETFSSSSLAMSVALLSIFVNQSLRSYSATTPDALEDDSVNGASAFFLAVAMVFFTLFGIIVLLYALVKDRHVHGLGTLLRTFEAFIFIGWVVPIVTAVVAQRSFKLRASFS